MQKTLWFVLAFCFAVVRPLPAAEPQLLPRELLDAGWIQLFDGQTLFGWQRAGDAEWDAVDGEIRTGGVKEGFLATTTAWADYELHVEFHATAASNSGVFLRTALQPIDPAKDCIELNIAPRDNPFPTASLVSRKVIGPQIDAWDGKWHAFDVVIEGESMTISLDGHRLETVNLSTSASETPAITPRIGYVSLQSRTGPVAFRNIRLRPLGTKPLFNGRDLDNWTAERAEQSKFDVADGAIRVLNGPGQLESNQEFANFVLQLECQVNGDGLNSGVFFRTLRKGRWSGYESQISNRFNNSDRTKPFDFGTGAIYSRQAARYVVPNDRQWFTNTIVADGPHMAVWVDGYQVSDWTDSRPAAENAREGRRDGPGAFAIQGHDPTTNLLFRNLRAAELPR